MSPRTQTREQKSAGSEIDHANKNLIDAASAIFGADPRVRSVGIGKQPSKGVSYIAVRNTAVVLAQTTRSAALTQHQGVPVTFIDSDRDPERLIRLPHSGPGSPTAASMIPEQARHRPLVAGLQIENFDDDVRTGVSALGQITVGTLGCFVKLQNEAKGILSNNHVVAGQNRGLRGSDRILQPSASNLGAPSAQDIVGLLSDFVALQPSPIGATVGAGAILNDVDAATVELNTNNANAQQQYLPSRKLKAPNGFAQAQLGDKVFKVGRTTGLTLGEVTQLFTVVGPIPYDPGPCWFGSALVIEGQNGTMFSDHGDSGSAIVRDDGKILGVLYAGNGQQTYACPIDLVIKALKCTIL